MSFHNKTIMKWEYTFLRQDPELFKETMEEANRLLRISEDIRVTVEKISPIKEKKEPPIQQKAAEKHNGFCIRTGAAIPFNVEKPLSYKAYKAG
ncbi:MAG: hypothetical protein U0T75_00795 [Chitinophagales bacterium]